MMRKSCSCVQYLHCDGIFKWNTVVHTCIICFININKHEHYTEAFYFCYYNCSFNTDALPTELRILRNRSTINIDPYPQDSSLYYQLSPSSDNDTSSWIMLNEESISTVCFKETYEIPFSICPGVTENRTFIMGL